MMMALLQGRGKSLVPHEDGFLRRIRGMLRLVPGLHRGAVLDVRGETKPGGASPIRELSMIQSHRFVGGIHVASLCPVSNRRSSCALLTLPG